jgi:hypothetical protein
MEIGWFQLAPGSVTIYGFLVVILTVIALAVKRRIEFIRRVDCVPGEPSSWTILGNLPTKSILPEGKCSFYLKSPNVI